MIEKTVIQNDSSAVRSVEDYIAAVCYENHLDNYHATIAVPVLGVVQAMIGDYSADMGSIVLQSDYCREGVFFNITSSADCFHREDQGIEASPTPLSDSLSLAGMLEGLQQGRRKEERACWRSSTLKFSSRLENVLS